MIKSGNQGITKDMVERIFKRLDNSVEKLETLGNLIETVEISEPNSIIIKNQFLEFLRLHTDALSKGNALKKLSILRTIENIEKADEIENENIDENSDASSEDFSENEED